MGAGEGRKGGELVKRTTHPLEGAPIIKLMLRGKRPFVAVICMSRGGESGSLMQSGKTQELPADPASTLIAEWVGIHTPVSSGVSLRAEDK